MAVRKKSIFLERSNFVNDFNVICPVQPHLQKYTASSQTQITLTNPAIPSREEGRWPSSRTLGRVAVDAAASGARGVRRAVIRERTSRRRTTLKRFRDGFGWPALGWSKFLAGEAAYGKTVWFWRPLLASSRRRFAKLNRAMRTVNSLAMEARRIRLQGEHGICRQTIARGMPGCFGCTCMLVCAFLSASCTRDRGCQSAPGIPCALSFLEGKRRASLGCNAPRDRGAVLTNSATSLRGALATKQSSFLSASGWIASLRSQ